MDYTSDPITATFPAGTTTTTINVPVTRDSIFEQPETFDLSFTIPTPPIGPVVPGTITSAVGIINDDIRKILSSYELCSYVYFLLI